MQNIKKNVKLNIVWTLAFLCVLFVTKFNVKSFFRPHAIKQLHKTEFVVRYKF